LSRWQVLADNKKPRADEGRKIRLQAEG